MDSFQKQSQNRIQHQASGNVPDLSHLVEEVNTSDTIPNQPPQQNSNPPKKSNIYLILFILGIFFLLSTLSIIGVYVNQQRQLADTRGRAQQANPYPCANEGASCESQSCCSGLVCQGVIGSRICNRPQTSPDAQCRVGGNTTATCSRIMAFRCNQWFANECLDNPQFFNDMQSAIAYVNGCGQIDIVCNEGPNENRLCGDFTIYKNQCGQTEPTSVQPTNTQPPQPTNQLAECRNIKIYRNNVPLTRDQLNTIKPGNQLVLAVVAVNATQARFIINNAIPQVTTQKNTAGEFILTYTVPTITQPTNFTIKAEVFGNGQWR